MIVAEILATGDEIRTGALVDSNSAHVAEQLERHGVEVKRHQSVGDDLNALIQMIDEMSHRTDIAIVTGGLGPTIDDRTAEAVAKAAGVDLALDERALRDIEQLFKKLGKTVSPTNRKQALIPKGGRALYNPVGTAPGFSLKIKRCTFYCLPGVPQEMKIMLQQMVLPEIEKMQNGVRQYSLIHTLSTFGLPESVVGERMMGITQEFPEITLGLRAKFPEIQVKFYLRTPHEKQGLAMLNNADQWACERLGGHVFSRTGCPMAEEVGRLLMEKGATLSVAESCTGGLIGNWLTNTAGSSNYFRLSAVTYHNQAKVDLLGISEKILNVYGAVHEKTAGEMAEGARRVGGSHFGLATSGIAGPDGGSAEKPVGTVCIGLATPDKTATRTFQFGFGRRLMNKRIFAMTALDMLRRDLIMADSSA